MNAPLAPLATLASIAPLAPPAALQTHPWAFPALEAIHIAGIAVMLGNLVLFELRLFGAGAALPIRALARLALPLVVAGFVAVVASGLLMFASQAGELLTNPAFRLKMLLLLAAGGNALWFHARGTLSRAAAPGRAPDPIGRLLGALSLALWLGVLACGRAIAYV